MAIYQQLPDTIHDPDGGQMPVAENRCIPFFDVLTMGVVNFMYPAPWQDNKFVGVRNGCFRADVWKPIFQQVF
ncbi:MAG: hypothetical protein A2X72_21855 [Burkholderiales bacterium GWF1_66_17]|nr:MAG: hypothetical protein A2X72_21855 [Burkholderiales bacterium GWF1_66_17]